MVAKKTTAAPVATRPAALNPDAVVIEGEIEDAPNAFASSGVADDHPLAVAYQASLQSGVAKKINTSTPDLVVKLLRKIAAARNLGIRIQANGNEVTFRAGEKKKSTRTDLAPAEVPVAELPTADALLNGGEEYRDDQEYDE